MVAMRENVTEEKKELFELVIRSIKEYGVKKTRDAIHGFHFDLPEFVRGTYVFNTENSWMLRRYRNHVSPDPAHLIDAAKAELVI